MKRIHILQGMSFVTLLIAEKTGILIYDLHYRDAITLLQHTLKGTPAHFHPQAIIDHDGGYIVIDTERKEIFDRQSCFPILTSWRQIS